jgi:hypothetical protein
MSSSFQSSSRGSLPAAVEQTPLVLQLLTHHTNLKQDPFCRNPLANRFQLRRRNLLRTMRDIQQHAFELIKYGSQRRVALLHRCLPVQAILFQQILRAPLLGRDVHLLGTRSVCGFGIRQFHQHHFGAAEMFANSHDQDALPNVGGIRDRLRRSYAAARQERHNYQRCHRCECRQTPRLEQPVPARDSTRRLLA